MTITTLYCIIITSTKVVSIDYYYDAESGLYYLINRYYDPELGRFISCDHIGYMAEQTDSINGCNLYAYCLNNPVMGVDPEGTLPFWLNLLLGGLVIIGLGILSVATAGASAAVAAVTAGAFKGAMVGAAIGTGVGAVTGGIEAKLSGGDVLQGIAEGMAEGFAGGAISGAFNGALGSLSSKALTGTKLLVNRAIQVGGNMAINSILYTNSRAAKGKNIELAGYVAAGISGLATGILYNKSNIILAGISMLSMFIAWLADLCDDLLR